jgi:Apea-like HEPN
VKYIYITALIDFSISESLKSPVEVKDGLYITNNPSHTAAYLSTSNIVTVGTLEARLLTSSTPVLYRFDNQSVPETAHVEVVNFLREVQAFLTATWLIEDNSANCELAFAFCQETQHTHSNSLALHNVLHNGTKRAMLVDRVQLQDICALHRSNFAGRRMQDAPLHTNFRRSTRRLSRAILFLQQARSADDLGQKIANYCSFFEATLSTSSAELSHQLSERVAFFLCDTAAERLATFKEIKKAYGVRSKIVHGDVLTQGAIDSLVKVSSVCDETARKLVRKIMSSENLTRLFDQSTSDALDLYMMDLIFGVLPNADYRAVLAEP